MKKTIIFYGSTSGNCEGIAHKISKALGLGQECVSSASNLDANKLSEYDNLLLGSSTWGSGDLQDDWYDAIKVIESSDLSGKTVAVFGCGDSYGFDSTYCEAMGTIYDAAAAAGARMIGQVPVDGYSFSESKSARDGKFVGLALDEDNESDKTDDRIAKWVDSIKDLL